MVSGRWKVVLTQTAFPCPVRSDQRNRGKETSGSDFRCSNGSRCPARLLFSRYLCSVEILLVVWDSRSGSWWVEWLRWGGLGEGFVVRVTWWPAEKPTSVTQSDGSFLCSFLDYSYTRNFLSPWLFPISIKTPSGSWALVRYSYYNAFSYLLNLFL